MGQVRLKKLVLNNFRTFQGRHSIEFPESGLIILKGLSGHGKSNVLLGLAYAFRICPHSAKDLQCWYTDDSMSVEVELDTDEGVVILKRGEELSLTIGGKTIKGSAKVVEARLDLLCGVGYNLREILTYRDQGKPKKVLSMSDPEIKKFLTQVLGLEELEKGIEEAAKKIGPIESSVENAESVLKALQIELDERKKEAVPRPVPDTEPVLERLDAATKRVTDLETSFAELNVLRNQSPETIEKESQLAQCREFLQQTKLADMSKRKIFDSSLAALNMEIRHLHNELAKIPSLKNDIERLSHESESLKKDVCPTCERTWGNAEEAFKQHSEEIEKKKKSLEEIKAHKPLLKEKEASLKASVFVSSPDIEKLEQIKQKLTDDLAQLMSEGLNKNTSLLADLSAAKIAKHVVEKELSLLEAECRYIEQNNNGAVVRLVQTQSRFEAAKASRDKVKKEWTQELDYLELIKGFRNKVFDEVLASISTEATAVVADLPNAQHIVVEFKSERATTTGNIEQRIRPVTYLHGEERPLASSVSGGQFTSVSLAIDLAVMKVVGQRLGCNLQWVIFDETFHGHDPKTKEACLALLQKYASDKLVIIVDHASEFQEFFTKMITVVLKDKVSEVQIS